MNTLKIRRLYKLKKKAGLNGRILNISSDCVNNFRKLNLSDVELIDLQDKYKGFRPPECTINQPHLDV